MTIHYKGTVKGDDLTLVSKFEGEAPRAPRASRRLSPSARSRLGMKAGGWPSIALIYLFGVLASASLTKVIPLQQDLADHIGMTVAQYTLLLSLLSVPAALTATVVGGVIDRIGSRTALICAAAAGALANLMFLLIATPRGFHGVRLFEGLVMVGVYSAAPALIMATTST